jgi:hypothetical protein
MSPEISQLLLALTVAVPNLDGNSDVDGPRQDARPVFRADFRFASNSRPPDSVVTPYNEKARGFAPLSLELVPLGRLELPHPFGYQILSLY